jgi:poly(3-hydroxybutyrate) depolymerase
MNRVSRRLASVLATCSLFLASCSLQERAVVPVTIDGEQVKLATITYKPPGNGPFPTLIFHHGSTGFGYRLERFSVPYDPDLLARWFTTRGPGQSGCEGSP